MKKSCLILALLLLVVRTGWTTHLRAGEIIVTQINNSTTCKITVRVYTNTGSTVLFGGRPGDEDFLDFGDGSNPMLIPEQNGVLRPDLGPNIGMAEFTITHTYVSKGAYLITYSEPNRNEDILNFHNSVNTKFFLQSYITLGDDFNYDSPEFLLPPLFNAVAGEDYAEAMGALDHNDFTLSYELVAPSAGLNDPVDNFRYPENFSINQFNGMCTWDTKFLDEYHIGEFGFAIKVTQVREGRIIGFIVRDFQIAVDQASESTLSGSFAGPEPEDENGKIYVPLDSDHTIKLIAGGEFDSTDIQITSELKNFEDNFSYEVTDSLASDSTSYKIAEILVRSAAAIERDNPYLIAARATYYYNNGEQRKHDMAYLIMTRDIELLSLIVSAAGTHEPFSVSMHPNPVQDFLKIELPDTRKVGIRIVDEQGRSYIDSETQQTSVIDLRHLPDGMYICMIKRSGVFYTYKFIKK